MPRETNITEAIMHAARALGCFVSKRHGSVFGITGEPDLMLLIPVSFQRYPIPVFIEVKVPGKTPRALQVYRLGRLERAGAVVASVTSVKEVTELIRMLRT